MTDNPPTSASTGQQDHISNSAATKPHRDFWMHRETHSRAFLWFIRFFWYGLGLMSGWMTVHAH